MVTKENITVKMFAGKRCQQARQKRQKHSVERQGVRHSVCHVETCNDILRLTVMES